MRDARRSRVARPRACGGHRRHATWELAAFIAGLLLALLSAPAFWL